MTPSLRVTIYAALTHAGSRGIGSAELVDIAYAGRPRPRSAAQVVRRQVHCINASLAKVGQRIVSDGHKATARWRLEWCEPARMAERPVRRAVPDRFYRPMELGR